MDKIPVSACIIAQNEEKYIEKAIQNVRFNVGEVVVIDGGSSDRTVAIARDLGCRVVAHEFKFHFSDQRNFGAEQCENDWILWCDADEWFSEKFFDLVPSLVTKPPEYCAAFHVFRVSRFDGEVKGEDFQWRLVDKRHAKWKGKVHEGLKFDVGHKGLKLPAEFKMWHEHSMKRQLYNNALYYNVNKDVQVYPEKNIGMEFHKDKWIEVETERDG